MAPSGAPEITTCFGWVRVFQSLVFYVVVCVLLFVYSFSFSMASVYIRHMNLNVPLVYFPLFYGAL